jgi:hypothetical protein
MGVEEPDAGRLARASNWLLDRRWAIAWLFFGLLAGVSGYFVYDENRLLAGAPTTPAVITDTELFPIRGEAHIDVDVLLPGGRTLRTSTSDFFDVPRPKKGDRIEVEYRIHGTDILVRETGTGPDLTGQWGWTATASVSTLIATGLFIRRTRRWRK